MPLNCPLLPSGLDTQTRVPTNGLYIVAVLAIAIVMTTVMVLAGYNRHITIKQL